MIPNSQKNQEKLGSRIADRRINLVMLIIIIMHLTSPMHKISNEFLFKVSSFSLFFVLFQFLH